MKYEDISKLLEEVPREGMAVDEFKELLEEEGEVDPGKTLGKLLGSERVRIKRGKAIGMEIGATAATLLTALSYLVKGNVFEKGVSGGGPVATPEVGEPQPLELPNLDFKEVLLYGSVVLGLYATCIAAGNYLGKEYLDNRVKIERNYEQELKSDY